jgi:hypothetical protein
LRRDISKDNAISFDDVISPVGRIEETLWHEQNALFQSQMAQAPLLGQLQTAEAR